MSTTPEERYAALVETLCAHANVAPHRPPKSGGPSSSLCVNAKIFVMLVKGRLVVKLPAKRVAELVAAGEGQPHDPGDGRVMKEWVAIPPEAESSWLPLAREALAFVGSKS
jgi:hypothetical protein